MFLVDLFWLFYIAWTNFRLVMCFLTFPFKSYIYKKFKLSTKDYFLLIYTFMCMIIFLRIIIISFQSHQIRILSLGLGMAWNRDGLFWIGEDAKFIYLAVPLRGGRVKGLPLRKKLLLLVTCFLICWKSSDCH